MNYDPGLRAAYTTTVAFVPHLLAFLAVLIIGLIIAQAVGKAVTKAFTKMGVDKALERGGIRAALERSGYTVSYIAGKVVYFALTLLVLTLAFGLYGPNPISALLNQLIAFLPNILVAIALLVIAATVASFVKDIVAASLGGLSYGRTVAAFAAGAIMVFGVFAALNQLAIAPAIVNGLYYAVLASVVGVVIVAVGGGGIQPMRAQWENALAKLETEAPRIQQQALNTHPTDPIAPDDSTVPDESMAHYRHDLGVTPRG